jgi:hypothetical protein
MRKRGSKTTPLFHIDFPICYQPPVFQKRVEQKGAANVIGAKKAMRVPKYTMCILT